MKNNQKFVVLFWLNHQRAKDGRSPIYFRISIDGQRAVFSTKYYLLPTQWDAKAGYVKKSDPDNGLINCFIDNTKSDLRRMFLEEAALGKEITAAQLKNKYLGIEEKSTYKTLCEAFDYHNLKMADMVKIGKISPKTLLRYQITKNKVVAFMQQKFKVSDKPLPELRLAFITEFEHHLLTVDKIQSNTAHKYIKNLKKIMNMAVGLDWIPSSPFNLFKCSYVHKDREILNQEEIDVIRYKRIDIPRLAEVRDVFVFCCYTGFAYSDVYQFPNNAVTIGLDGEYWLSTNRQKTGTKESVPLLPVALEIIEKYRSDEYCRTNNKLLPVNSNQRYNSYLKELAAICGINKHLTTHIARHTFATTVTLANGVPIETVSSMLGHTSIRTTQVYAKVVEQKVSDDMKALRLRMAPGTPDRVLKIG